MYTSHLTIYYIYYSVLLVLKSIGSTIITSLFGAKIHAIINILNKGWTTMKINNDIVSKTPDSDVLSRLQRKMLRVFVISKQ